MTPLEMEVRSRKYQSLRLLPVDGGWAVLDHGYNLTAHFELLEDAANFIREEGPKQTTPCIAKPKNDPLLALDDLDLELPMDFDLEL